MRVTEMRLPVVCAALLALAGLKARATDNAATAPLRPGSHFSPWFGEHIREQWIENDVRVVVNLPGKLYSAKPTELVIFATPNGNTIENTLGCVKAKDLDWHFDIQHVAAQIRHVREKSPSKNIILACIEAEGLTWPGWRSKHPDAAAKARRVVEWIRNAVGSVNGVVLTGHSGGGSFVLSYINGGESIPNDIERISFLDSNYAYSDDLKHGDKLIAWLKGGANRHLTVIAYDDREITLNGKKVVGPTGGTFRATERMLKRFNPEYSLHESKAGEFTTHAGLGGRVSFYVHPNPENKILHTVMVGEMNGVIKVLTDDSVLGTPRQYSKWIQPAPGIPNRPKDAIGGRAFMTNIADLPRDEREAAIRKEVLSGNIPDFLRQFQKVTVQGQRHSAVIEVMPDYLAIGSNDDFVRIPMNPQTAQTIADSFGCSLPTKKMIDEIYRHSGVKLEPVPLTKDRESPATFLQHHDLIEKQRVGRSLGEVIGGIKKDVVLTNRLGEKPNRVAIYGWHKLDGKPIQPLTTVHVNWYVDYSHGVRLIKRNVMIDGKPRDIRYVLHDPAICELLSDEGPIQFPSY